MFFSLLVASGSPVAVERGYEQTVRALGAKKAFSILLL